MWCAGRDAAGPEPPARAARLGGGVSGDRLPRAGLERRRPPRATCRPRSTRCRAHGVRVLASSSTYDTDPVGEVLDQPAFLNACVRIETELEPEALLDACKAVERELGRDLDRAASATARARSTSTCCCSATARTAPSA